MQQDLTFISLGQNVESAAQHKAVRSHVSKLNRRNELARKRASKSRSHSGAARPIAPASAKPEYQQLARLGDTTSPRISPLFEGSSTVPQVNAPVTLEVVDYVFKFLFPNIFIKKEIADLFAAFCQHPVTYHAHAYYSFVNKQRACGPLTSRDEAGKLSSGMTTFQLLRDLLDSENLSTPDGEMALLAMQLTLRDDDDSQSASKSWRRDQLLLISHMPWAEGVDYVNTGHPDGCVLAMIELVRRMGGLDRVRMPLLRRTLPMCDLLNASRNMILPLLPLYWELDIIDVLRSPLWPFTNDDQPFGAGFAALQNHLSATTTKLMQDISIVDQIMSLNRNRRMEDADFQLLMSARNNVQHRLLSLPRWIHLEPPDQSSSHQYMHDSCRCAALIYSNTVLRPSSDPGVLKPLEELASFLDEVESTDWPSSGATLKIWVAFIAGMAAYGTQYRQTFAKALGRLLERQRLTSLQNAKSAVRPFVWSDHACEQGALVLWQFIENDAR